MKPWAVRTARWLRRVVAFLGIGYPVALVVVAAMIRLIGEAWPATAVALYLPAVGFAAPLPFVVAGLLAFRMRRLLLAQLLGVFVLVFVLMGFVLPWPHGRDPAAPTLRVLSYNVDSGRAGADAIAATIDRYSPDVVFMQEIADARAIEAMLRERYPTVSASTQFIVASRYPISSSVDPGKLPYGDRLRSARFVQQRIETPLGSIAFYNVHPISPRDAFNTLRGGGLRHEIASGRIFSAANGKIVSDNFGLRALQVQAIAEAAARETVPVVIAGDTNLPGSSRIFAANLSGYADGFTRAGWGFGYTYPRGKHGPWMRIDRILAGDGLRFVGFEVGDSDASDHFCVVADLQKR